MLLTAFFSDKGVPKIGLSPTIDIWEDDATHVVNAQNMTEIAGGFYKYDFGGYDESKEYSIRADGGVGLVANDRYVYGTNEVGQVTEDLTDIKGTGFVKDTDSLIDIRPETDKIQMGIIDVPNNYKADVSLLALEASVQLVKTEVDKIQTDIIDVPNNYKADVAALALEATAQLIKTEADKIQTDIIDVPDNYKADISTLALEATAQLIKTETDKIVYILGLVQENFRLKDQVYNVGGNLTSATIRIYGSAADCEADVNAIAEYTMTATYDASGNCTSYKVKKT